LKTDRRHQILEISQRLFVHYGFQKVTFADIARELGVSRPTVYQEFANKEEILKTLLMVRHEEFLNQIDEVRAGKLSVRKKLERAIEIWVIEPFQILSTSPGLKDFQDGTLGFAEETINAGYQAFETKLQAILQDHSVSGTLSNKASAHLITYAVRGFKLLAKDEKSLQRLTNDLLSLVLGNEAALER